MQAHTVTLIIFKLKATVSLQHSLTSTGQKELTDINKLTDEYLRLSYNSFRAKDKNFNAEIKTDFD